MKDTAYAFCVGRIRANEKKLLDSAFINKLTDSGSFDVAVKLLREIGWTDNGNTVKEIINAQNDRLWSFIIDSVPDENAVKCLCVLNDFFNIKCAVKCAFAGENPTDYFIRPSSFDFDELSKIILSKNFSAINNPVFRECAQEAYDFACKTENGQNAEIIIDCATLNALIDYSKKHKNSLFSEICDFFVDTSNIKTAFRCLYAEKNMDFVRNAISDCRLIDSKTLISCVANGKEALNSYLLKTVYSKGVALYDESPVLYEKWCDEQIIRIIGRAKFTAFGFDPVCAYYYARLNEIKNVRIILTSLQSGISVDKIKERVRLSYV